MVLWWLLLSPQTGGHSCRAPLIIRHPVRFRNYLPVSLTTGPSSSFHACPPTSTYRLVPSMPLCAHVPLPAPLTCCAACSPTRSPKPPSANSVPGPCSL